MEDYSAFVMLKDSSLNKTLQLYNTGVEQTREMQMEDRVFVKSQFIIVFQTLKPFIYFLIDLPSR